MPKRSNEFQRLVLTIERLLAEDGAKITESRELVDSPTGKLREVDVVIERSDGIRSFIVSIECSAGGRPASVEWVERMWGKHAHLPTDKLILLSKKGFSAEALSKAQSLKIVTLSLQQAKRHDWKSLIPLVRKVNVTSYLKPYITSVKFVLAGDSASAVSAEELNLDGDSVIFNPDGSVAGQASNILDKAFADANLQGLLLAKAKTDAISMFELEMPLEPGSSLQDKNGKRWLVLRFDIQAKCRKESTVAILEAGQYGTAMAAHGSAKSFGNTVQVVAAQKQGHNARLSVSIIRAGKKD